MNTPINDNPHWSLIPPWKPEDVIEDCIKRLKKGLQKLVGESPEAFQVRKEEWRLSLLRLIWIAKQDTQLH